MRALLEGIRSKQITLQKEIEFIKHYLSVQQQRYGNCFAYEINVETGLNVEKVLIHTMMVQPMVENAIEHGIIKSKNDGFLSLNFSKHDGSLIINISDNGKGLSEDFQFKPDHALQIIKEHVNLIKQKTGIGSLEINQGVEGKGLTVIITLPYLTE